MKYLRQLDITATNPELTKSIINHYRSEFLFSEPDKYSGQTPLWTEDSAAKSVSMVNQFRDSGTTRKNLTQELIDWIEFNKKAREPLYNVAMRLMKINKLN
jgi:hypothetical protein